MENRHRKIDAGASAYSGPQLIQTPMASTDIAMTDQMRNSGSSHFAHLIHGTPATARLAISGPEVGKMLLENPSPNWNDWTATCRVTPIMSASGVWIGMMIAA